MHNERWQRTNLFCVLVNEIKQGTDSCQHELTTPAMHNVTLSHMTLGEINSLTHGTGRNKQKRSCCFKICVVKIRWNNSLKSAKFIPFTETELLTMTVIQDISLEAETRVILRMCNENIALSRDGHQKLSPVSTTRVDGPS